MPAAIVPVILSGGSGSRLWPLSRSLYPKQFLKLYSELTLLQETARRLPEPPLVVCNEEHRFIVAEQLRAIGIEPRGVVIEPIGRNTAPAAAVAALMLTQGDETADPLMLVMPSDHMVGRPEAFRAAVERAVPLARSGLLVAFGIEPDEPNTGYGYIERGEPRGEGFDVTRFVEKPDLATAETYVASGRHYWNSGIFLFPARRYLDELARHAPDMVEGCRHALADGLTDMFFLRLNAAAFAAITGDSIDYAVMEKADRVAMVPVDMGWTDIGSWSALWRESPQNQDGNVLEGDVIAVGTSGSYVRSERPLVATIGLTDTVVVATDDVVLVADRSRDQEVKAVIASLNQAGRSEAAHGRRVFRPWGWYQTTDLGDRFQVKHIQVNPGAKLSLQKHWHRSEHWIVVSGTALVTRGQDQFVLHENESTYIPATEIHRLENPGKIPLRLIEVQSGPYVGEDDIVRVEDVYGRLPASESVKP